MGILFQLQPERGRLSRSNRGRTATSPSVSDYGLVAVFGVVLVQQLGAPIPATPVLWKEAEWFCGPSLPDIPPVSGDRVQLRES